MTIIVVALIIFAAVFVMSALAAPPRKHEACNGDGCDWCEHRGYI
jgi:hypothetical protein